MITQLSPPTVAKVLTGWQSCPRHSTQEPAALP